MKSYLFTYSQACTQARAHAILDATQAIDTWVAPFPYAAILVSRLNVQDLTNVLHGRLPDVWFMVTEVNRQSANGWLPGDLWLYVNDPYEAWAKKIFADAPNAKGLRPVSDADSLAGT